MLMLRRHSRAVRLFWLVVAALQFAGPPAAAWADAQLEAQSEPGAPQHVHEHSSSRCPRGHSADCVLCHYLTRPLIGGVRQTPVIPAAGGRTPAPPSSRSYPTDGPSLLPRSRAPPAFV
jgi:hypothetical protein